MFLSLLKYVPDSRRFLFVLIHLLMRPQLRWASWITLDRYQTMLRACLAEQPLMLPASVYRQHYQRTNSACSNTPNASSNITRPTPQLYAVNIANVLPDPYLPPRLPHYTLEAHLTDSAENTRGFDAANDVVTEQPRDPDITFSLDTLVPFGITH